MQLLQHLLKCLHVLFDFTFGVDEDVIEIHYHKNVKLLCQDLINVALKRDRGVGQSKRYNLVLEIAIAGPEGCFLFVAFPDLHLIVSIGQIKLGKTPSPT